jgi:hypothetical protein
MTVLTPNDLRVMHAALDVMDRIRQWHGLRATIGSTGDIEIRAYLLLRAMRLPVN